MSSFRRVSAVSLIAGCAVALGPTASAQASNATLLATIKQDAPKITRSQAKIIDGLATLEKSGSSKAIVKAIKAQDKDLTALKNHLSGESSSSAAGSKGKRDITTGLAIIARANTTLEKDIAKTTSGKSVSKAQVKAATAAVQKGNADLNAGVKLLKG